MTQFVLDPTKLLQTAKEKQNAIKSRKKTIKPKEGSNRYVLLPGWDWKNGKQDVWFHDFGTHFIKDEKGDLQSTYICLDRTYGRPCPVCQALKQLSPSVSSDAQIEAIEESAARQSYLLNVLALDSDSPNEPQTLEVGKKVFSAIFDVLAKWGARLFDPNGSQVIVINRSGVGKNTQYTVLPDAETKAVPPAVYDKLPNLDEYVAQENEQELRKSLGNVQAIGGLLPDSSAPVTQPSALLVSPQQTAQPQHQQTQQQHYQQHQQAEDAAFQEVAMQGSAQAAHLDLDSDLDDLLNI